jgi:hypothetical protein
MSSELEGYNCTQSNALIQSIKDMLGMNLA